MADSAHVQTKSQIPLASSRDITATLVQNPTSDDIANYNTALDPSVVSGKDNKLDLAAVDLNNEPIPLWYSKYGTGLDEAEIFYKTVLYSNGKQVVITGDQPYVFDIGPTVDLPPLEDEPSLDDEWHKNVVTDLIPIDTVIAPGVSTPAISTMSMYNMIREAQYMLFPVSSRHICKTSDGALHAVVSYDIDGLSRIIYLKSINGGATWTSTIVDNDDGCDYVLPSITCDSADGIHITWSRWKYVIGWTYWLYSGSDTPEGFTCISDDSSDMAYQRLLCGGVGSYSANYGTNAKHDHGYSMSGGGVVGGCHLVGTSTYSAVTCQGCGWHHTGVTTGDKSASSIPASKTLRVLRYNGFPHVLPVGIIVLFDTASLPTGYSRYSAQDGKFIFCSDSVGSLVGSTKHSHTFNISITGSYGSDLSWYFTSYTTAGAHSGSFTDNAANNSPPGYTVVLGEITSEQSSIPQHAIIMCDSNGLVDTSLPFTLKSGVGDELYDRYLIGGSSYASVTGSLAHGHGSKSWTSGQDCSTVGLYGTEVSHQSANECHAHSITFTCANSDHVLPYFAPHMYHADESLDISSMGNDIFYLHIDSIGNADSLVNITKFYDGIYQSFECTCLCDSSDVVHFLWVSRGINTTETNPRVCYKQMVAGVLGSIEYPTTADVACIYPSFDIDVNGHIHCAWGVTSSTAPKIQYCKRESSWGSVEDVDTTQYCGFPSNVVVDSLFNVYLQYSRWSDDETKISDVYYNKRSVGVGWGTPVNLSPGKLTNTYNQFPGQTYIDNKGNVVFTFTGKGYGSHTTVYHPVYRYLTAAGTLVPAAGDASDIFPDDDNEIIYPSVFWHTFPLVSSVYHNLPVAGMTFLYLYNIRGADYDTADIKFYSSPNALVGDVGSSGVGGSGEGDFSPGGVGAESLLQFESFRVTVRGYIGKTSFINEFGGYIV